MITILGESTNFLYSPGARQGSFASRSSLVVAAEFLLCAFMRRRTSIHLL